MTRFAIEIEVDEATLERFANEPGRVDAAMRVACDRLRAEVDSAICTAAGHAERRFGSLRFCERCNRFISKALDARE